MKSQSPGRMERGPSPSISVVIPLYNKGPWVAGAVESALNQDWSPLEVIVVDDGSTDSGQASLARFDERVRVLQQPNAGVSAARNRGIAAARGDWVALLDADDRFLQGHLRSMVELSRNYPEAAVLCSGYRNIWPDGRTQPVLQPGSGLLPDFFKVHRKWLLCASSVCVRRTALVELGDPFPVGVNSSEDLDCWFRLAERWPVAYMSRIGADYRRDLDGSLTQRHDLLRILPAYQRLADRVENGAVPMRLRPSAKRAISSHYLTVARRCMRSGEVSRAWELIGSRWARADVRYWIRTVIWAEAVQLGWW